MAIVGLPAQTRQGVRELAAHGCSALVAAYRFAQERRISLSLQRSLLPGRLGVDEAVEIAWRYLPASGEGGVGGDWVDAIPLSGARVALVVGDVVGHGVTAAAAMGRLRAAVHTLAAMDCRRTSCSPIWTTS